MTWEYIAGFWDGEGWVSFHNHAKGRGGKAQLYWNIGACQSQPQDKCLFEIQEFLLQNEITSCLDIAKSNGPRRHPVTKIRINGNRDNKINFLRGIQNFSIVKRPKIEECLLRLTTLPYKPHNVKNTPKAYKFYWEAGAPLQEAGKKFGISERRIKMYAQEYGLPLRSLSESHSMGWTKKRKIA